MGAIGGYYDGSGKKRELLGLRAMGRAMAVRGGARQQAYIAANGGVFCGCGEERLAEVQMPYTDPSGQLVAVWDGSVRDGFEAMEEIAFGYNRHQAVCPFLSGGFAVALYDREREQLWLARDPEGRKPLYYRLEDGGFFFASELRGLFAWPCGPVTVNLDALERHLMESPRPNSVSRLYPSVGQVFPGECMTVSQQGSRRFYLGGSACREVRPYREERVFALADDLAEQGLSRSLTDGLYAFEYPQFDPCMPGLIALLRELAATGVGSVCVEDSSLREDLSYAYERADRLGARFGLTVLPVPPSVSVKEGGQHRGAEESLEEMVREEEAILIPLLGEGLLTSARKTAHWETRIRRLGMLWQTALWYRSGGKHFVSAARRICL